MSKVFIKSAGLVPVGEHWNKSLTDLMVEASLNALKGQEGVKIDRIVVGNMMSGYLNNQEHLGALLASALGMKGVEALKVEAACGSGGMAVHEGYVSVKSGEYENVLVVGVEKMKDVDTQVLTKALAMAESAEFTQVVGASFISLNALLMRMYMNRYNVQEDYLDHFPVIAHKNAVTAPHAQFKRAFTLEEVKRSPYLAEPIRLLSSAPSSDGAAAVLLSSKPSDVEILASEVSTNELIISQRENPLKFEATEKAFKKAIDKSGVNPSDVDFLEVHDAFPVVAALSLEAMGYSEEGKAGFDAAKGKYNFDGDLPILTFGGLKARGHPVGGTGVYQVVEAYMQLSGTAGKNQIQGAKLGVTQNVGGVDTTSVVHILRRVS
ncbi:MAG: beta-ketoacyl synthase N-terminal-like domain-containing protein [Conexivisphaerales archaeon]|nr:beta-ketoacyl synthase N-terminal-like domain-containing protein [Conexivisphaerales archaeon]